MKKALTYGLTHLAIDVNDLSRTLAFYSRVFDMEVMYHKNDFLQLTTPGAHDVIVFLEKKDCPFGKTGNIAHFGFRLRDPENMIEITRRVIEAGGTITDQGEFAPGFPKLFFRDLDGYEVEVWFE